MGGGLTLNPKGDLVHMWRCPKLNGYWREVVGTINKVFGIILDLDPKIFLLGCMEEDNMWGRHIAIIRCLFLAWKLIARKWLVLNPPTCIE